MKNDNRVEHKFISRMTYNGPICAKCGLAEIKHRVRDRYRYRPDRIDNRVTHSFVRSYVNPYACKECGKPEKEHRTITKNYTYIGIDGEGQSESRPHPQTDLFEKRVIRNHKYVLLAASDEHGKQTWNVTPKSDRLSTIECLDFILSLPITKYTKVFSFSFNYDLTKMLTDVDNEKLFYLFRPEERNPGLIHGYFSKQGPTPVEWNGYLLNLQGTKFTVRKGDKQVIIWDLFKFYQSKFVDALKKWGIGDPVMIEQMSIMKNKRSTFDEKMKTEVLSYCLDECKCIAQLARKLIDAHKKAGLRLHSFYGAGSSGAAMLSTMGIKDQVVKTPEAMKDSVASAFFGGRFENSIIGDVSGTIYDYDIASAYPYQLYFLPCLKHGEWTHTKKRSSLDGAKYALVHYGLSPIHRNYRAWGPFPFRTEDGSISFPESSGGGWVWLSEFLAGERIFPNVTFKEAWVYNTECDCHPFKKIAEYYTQRCMLGSDGAGIVLKLGCNSCYGKLAQSVGNAIFNCWIWAGMITSGTRAQILDLLPMHQDWNNLLTIATDGIKTREKLKLPMPLDTGTFDCLDKGKKKPLGSWEEKMNPRGLFVARPGVYFPLNPTHDELSEIKGRGVGKGTILENWACIVDAWKRSGLKGIAKVANVERFCGAKTCISYSRKGFKRANANDGIAPSYGQWIKRPVEMSFDPMPKREGVKKDGKSLILRKFPQELESKAYNRALHFNSAESRELRALDGELQEQPDKDYSAIEDYE